MPMLLPEPIRNYNRTFEERSDMFLAWNRPDKAFFASGACHILAELFCQLHQDEGYQVVHINPLEGTNGHHMFASNDTWAFDFNGWSRPADIVDVNAGAKQRAFPDWEYELVTVPRGNPHDFEAYCKSVGHRLPWQYLHLPWERAYKYIQQFPTTPPKK